MCWGGGGGGAKIFLVACRGRVNGESHAKRLAMAGRVDRKDGGVRRGATGRGDWEGAMGEGVEGERWRLGRRVGSGEGGGGAGRGAGSGEGKRGREKKGQEEGGFHRWI